MIVFYMWLEVINRHFALFNLIYDQVINTSPFSQLRTLKWESQIRNFHFAVLQRRLIRNNRKCTKSVMHVQSCCLYKPLAFFPFSMQISRSSRVRRGRQENEIVEMDY